MSKITLVREVLKEKPICNKSLLCQVLSVARSLIYYKSPLEEKDLIIRPTLEHIHTKHPWYGHRRIAWSMNMGFKKARRLMKKFSIFAKVKIGRKFVKKGDQNLPDTKIPNLTKIQSPLCPNVIWRSDFTHIIYHGIHLYLATVIDAYTREIVGYAISFVHTKEFVLEAIKMAMIQTGVFPLIFHSDQWSEYRSFLVLNFLLNNWIQLSMSKKWAPWENGGQESYYGKFKLELDNPNSYESIELLIEAIHHRIYYYNNERIHTALKMPPVPFRESHEERRKLIEEKISKKISKTPNPRDLPKENEFAYAQETGMLIPFPSPHATIM